MKAMPRRDEQQEILQLDALRDSLHSACKTVGLETLEVNELPGNRRSGTAKLRASGQKRSDVGETTASLVMGTDGVLRWQIGSMIPLEPDAQGMAGSRRGGRRRAGLRRGVGGSQIDGDVVTQVRMAPLGHSDVHDFLLARDASFSPGQGLNEVTKDGRLIPFRRDGRTPRRTLLIIHGTASNSQNMIDSLRVDFKDGKSDFMTWAQGESEKYDLILAFTHPTLSVSPILNAIALEAELGDLPGVIDIICHSRGGLVARWWYEVACKIPARRGKVIFACTPHGGTALASPSDMRKTLNFITNVTTALGDGLAVASRLFPFMAIAPVFLKLIGTFTSAVASIPLADMAIAMVPGLAAQSRIERHSERLVLQSLNPPAQNYFAISANFVPPPFSIWEFWKSFTVEKLILAPGADALFDEAHDLVVNTSSMTQLGSKALIFKGQLLEFGPNDHINHGTCFNDPRAVKFLKESLSK